MRGVYFEVGVHKVIRYVDQHTEFTFCTHPRKMAALKIEIFYYSQETRAQFFEGQLALNTPVSFPCVQKHFLG